jgi:hypothetical protein
VNNIPTLLTVKETALLLNIQPQTLAVWRHRRRFILPWVKVGNSIKYKLDDIQKFIEKNTHKGD